MSVNRLLPVLLALSQLVPCVRAQDTEIFNTSSTLSSGARPNILFVMDTSGSMNDNPSGESRPKIDIMKEALTTVIEQSHNINAGLARYSGYPGGPILYPVRNLDDAETPRIASHIISSSDDAEESSNGTVSITSSKLDLGVNANGKTLWTGLRFQDLAIPQGAKVSRAVLGFVADGTSTGSALSLRIYGHKTGNASSFDTTKSSISSSSLRPRTSKYVDWTPESWTTKTGYSSTDITTVVQELVDQSTWCGGNAMSLLLQNTSSATSDARYAYSYDNKNYNAPALYIEFTSSGSDLAFGSGANKCYSANRTITVSGSGDDVEQLSSGSMQTSNTSLGLRSAANGSANSATGLLFQGVNVPAASTISSAVLRVYAATAYTGKDTGAYTIAAVDQGNIASWPAYGGLSGSTALAQTTPVNVTLSATDLSNTEIAVDIPVTAQVQAIIKRSDWSINNNLALIIKPGSGSRNDYLVAFDQNPSRAPQLVIEYSGSYATGAYTVRDELKRLIADFSANSLTPISDLMSEAGRYFRGDSVDYGTDRGDYDGLHGNERWRNRVSDLRALVSGASISGNSICSLNPNDYRCEAEALSAGAKYQSPITDTCTANNIVFLSDGLPTYQGATTGTTYSSWTGNSCSSIANFDLDNASDDCALKIADFLANNDQGLTQTGQQGISTHTIGFDISSTFLQEMASKGKGNYYQAASTATLIDALDSVVASSSTTTTTFVAAGIAANQYNSLTNSDELYFALFTPTATQHWPGNLKRYRYSAGSIVDQKGSAALNSTGSFADDAVSFWSDVVDGGNVELGGALAQLNDSRVIYTDIAGDDLTLEGNRVWPANALLTADQLGSTESERTSLLNWLNGIDAYDADLDGNKTELLQHMGDPLHSRPNVVSYKNAGNVFSRLFVSTNEGLLHQFSTDTGKENWAYIPAELLDQLKITHDDSSKTSRQYGMDGAAVVYVADDNHNGMVDVGTEKAYLYIGERRGGNHLYALDISNPDQPVHLFTISNATTGYEQLGQTWSTPVVASVNVDGKSALSLLFGGGYDLSVDASGARSAVGQGNAVYIADALTGSLRWVSTRTDAQSADKDAGLLSEMGAVPGAVAAIDLDSDGAVDHFYVADSFGQIFRFDNKNGAISGGRIARLQQASTEAANRRFYSSPSVALMTPSGSSAFVSVAIGSGFREHPLDTAVDEHFYGLRDNGVLTSDFYKDIQLSDLIDVTNLVGDSNGDGQSDALVKIDESQSQGWYINFNDSGEKVIASALTMYNTVFFTSYLPEMADSSSCSTSGLGSNRLWAISLLDGNPVSDIKDLGTLDASDRFLETDASGLADFTPLVTSTDIQICVANDCLSTDEFFNAKRLTRKRWKLW